MCTFGQVTGPLSIKAPHQTARDRVNLSLWCCGGFQGCWFLFLFFFSFAKAKAPCLLVYPTNACMGLSLIGTRGEGATKRASFKGTVCRISVQLQRLDQRHDIFLSCVLTIWCCLYFTRWSHREKVFSGERPDQGAACKNRETGYNTTKKQAGHRETHINSYSPLNKQIQCKVNVDMLVGR